SPLPGAGTFADDRAGAVCCTGHGESILRVGTARTVAERLRSGEAPDRAANAGVEELVRLTGGTVGVIVVAAGGRAAHAKNPSRMPWAQIVAGIPSSGVEA